MVAGITFSSVAVDIQKNAHRPKRLDRAHHRWRADMGGGGDVVT
jgi:hypothetical protein